MDATISVITDNMTQGSANQNGNWAPSTIISVEVNVALTQGDHTMKAVMTDGVSDTMEFRA